MEKNYFEIDPAGRLAQIEGAGVVAAWRAGGGPFWIDVDSGDAEESARLFAELGLHSELIERIQEPGHAARVLPFDTGLFFEFPLQLVGSPPELKALSFVCLERLMVTIHSETFESGWTDQLLRSRVRLEDRSIAALLSAALTHWSMDLRRRSSEIRTATLVLSEKLDMHPEETTIDEILELKRHLADLDAISEEREATLETLETLESLKWAYVEKDREADVVRVALANTAATSRRIDRLGNRAMDLLSRYDATQQDKMNRRLSRLTIISAIFLPLTLLAGIYGMNFDVMPELHHPLGYPLALGVMALTAIGLGWWFRSRGWMD